MKKLILYIFLIHASFLFFTCRDPIFYNISQEEELLDPKIQGSPTNFVVFKGNMYVASGQYLYKYNGTAIGYTDRGSWEETSPVDGRIFGLAATNNSLYVLFEKSGKGILRVFDGKNWDDLEGSGTHNIRSIHSINEVLFMGAGAQIDSLYILYYDGTNFDYLMKDSEGVPISIRYKLLNGAAYNGTYYLSTKDLFDTAGGGIYSFTNDLTYTGLLGNNIPFVGIINIDDSSICAIDQNGRLYGVPAINDIANMGNYLATGALSIWQNERGRLLLAGRKDIMSSSVTSGYTYGYLELDIPFNGTGFTEPGIKDISTVNFGENGKYRSTIGKYPVNHIIQSPIGSDGRSVLFASTQKNGVWSYRQRGNDWHWNAEQ